LEEAIRKMTGFATGLLGISDRGLVKEGLYADMVVFNPDTVANRGTFANPKQYPAGIEYVLVNGQLTVVRNHYTGARAGKVLRSKFRQKGV
ncbi:MAG: amidohydrolase family protein, partial [Chloroflexota bacterium]|nr:amidohydrolase family protein [Chloroflexota bacterium]